MVAGNIIGVAGHAKCWGCVPQHAKIWLCLVFLSLHICDYLSQCMKVKNDHCSIFSNLRSLSPKKKIRASTGFEPVSSVIPVRCISQCI